MWEQKDYEYHGEHFNVPTPHNILPKPYGKGHPPMWVACGNPATFAKAGGHGIGAIAFNFEPIHNLKGRVEAYKEAAENVTDQIGQYQNNNVMMTNAVICLEDREEARAMAKRNLRGYRVTMVNLYHDSMPQSPDAIVWPNPTNRFELDDDMLDYAIKEGYMLCGNPEEVCEQVVAYQDVGCDQVAFGTPDEGYTHDQTIEMIECFGKYVIPEFDKDPVHSTTRMRVAAEPKFPMFNNPVDPIVEMAEPPEFPISV
jgi:alkanesulfonate monooxygenase SsuD/methylene tetrahydromethanopterin reductase-like flavin-dependent oxidoreductase (luciferase family)